jgi:hypothetical protein
MDFSLSAKWHLETGLALSNPYALEDRFGGNSTKISIQFGDTILSPEPVCPYSFTKKANPFAALSKGFRLLQSFETLTRG